MTSRTGLVCRAVSALRTGVTLSIVALVAGCGSGGNGGGDLFGLGALFMAAAPESEATVVGNDVGAGVGYIIGDEADRAKAARLDPNEHYEVGRIGATRWKVLDIQPYDRVPSFKEKIIYFRPDGRVETTTTFDDGRRHVMDESYRVVGGTIILNRRGYLVNAKYWLTGQQMILDGDDFRVVLLRLPS